MSKPTLVIVPGAWQMPVVWDAFRVAVKEAGYPPSIYVALPTIEGTGTPLPGLADDVVAVCNVLDPFIEQVKEVVLLCHFPGGVIGSNAAQSLLDLLCGSPLPWMKLRDRVSGDPGMFPQIGFNDLSPEDRARWAEEATHTSAALFAAPSGYEPGHCPFLSKPNEMLKALQSVV
ncbi:hypothetical protein GE09DRAFT_1174215 [Coniochaeta sp. 2T2.1]|nr:hypothetical protein GE09DRAFT_1174215 [Coniochaeta sp. 2T2.1]